MPKRKSNVKKEKLSVNNCRGIIIGGVIFYYENYEDFVEAYPGLCMWIEVETNKERG